MTTPRQIGKYRVLEEIASGSYGSVYKAFDPSTSVTVAVKVLHQHHSANASFVERFRREASLIQSIDHENVIRVLDVGRSDGRHFMTMELMPETLSNGIEETGAFPVEQAVALSIGIAEGIGQAHAQGIVHRDIKPQNVLLTPEGVPKVTDFGIARGEMLSTMTATGVTMGTPSYMSPEQANGERGDARSDVYSLGCLIYQLLSGEVPFSGDTPLAILKSHREDLPEPLGIKASGIPASVIECVEKAMSKDPSERFDDGHAFALALRMALPSAVPDIPEHVDEDPVISAPIGSGPSFTESSGKDEPDAEIGDESTPDLEPDSDVEEKTPPVDSGAATSMDGGPPRRSGVTDSPSGDKSSGRNIAPLIWVALGLLVVVIFAVEISNNDWSNSKTSRVPSTAIPPIPTWRSLPPTTTWTPTAVPPTAIRPTAIPATANASGCKYNCPPIPIATPLPTSTSTASPTILPTPDRTPLPVSSGGKIAFSSNRDGNYEIYMMDANGSNQVRLTSNSATDQNPDWSPDGSKIAFMSDRDGNREIYVMAADGSNVTRLTDNFMYDSDPSWSPDNSKIAFSSNRDGNKDEIYVMDADGSNQVRLTSNSATDQNPDWSPDGSKIAFHSYRDGDYEIYVMDAYGSNQTRLTSNSMYDSDPSWSPDGSKIAYYSNSYGNFDIYVMDADGSNKVRLTSNSAYDQAPSWSPDGSKIAFHSNRRYGNFEIYVMDADGSYQTRLTYDPDGGTLLPDWAPAHALSSSATPASAPRPTAVPPTAVPPTPLPTPTTVPPTPLPTPTAVPPTPLPTPTAVPHKSFTIESTSEQLLAAQGNPDSIEFSGCQDRYHYGISWVEVSSTACVASGVVGWNNAGGNLKLTVLGPNGSTFTLGSTAHQLLKAQGNPLRIESRTYYYGSSSVYVAHYSGVMRWDNAGGNLALTIQASDSTSTATPTVIPSPTSKPEATSTPVTSPFNHSIVWIPDDTGNSQIGTSNSPYVLQGFFVENYAVLPDLISIQIDWGDSRFPDYTEVSVMQGTGQIIANHTYTSAGSFTGDIRIVNYAECSLSLTCVFVGPGIRRGEIIANLSFTVYMNPD